MRGRIQECVGVPAMLIDVDGEHGDSARSIVAIDRVERGERFTALRTPARPELDQDDLAFEVQQANRRTFRSAKFYGWRGAAGDICSKMCTEGQDRQRKEQRRRCTTDRGPSLHHRCASPILGALPLEFRDLSFDASTRQVSRAGREVKLTRKAFDLLAMLIERRPNAVSKDDIHTHLWPDTYVAEITLHS